MRLLILASLCVCAPALAKTLESSAVAVDKDQSPAYYETHKLKLDENNQILNLVTIYTDKNKKQFARLESDFRKNAFVPTFNFEDTRFGRKDGLEWTNEGKLRIYGQENKNEEVKEKTIELEANMVAGQGLLNFVQHHLESMVKEKKIYDLKYIVPMNQDFYSLRLKLLKYDAETKIAKIRMEFDSWIMRLLTPHIDIEYNVPKKRLLTYKGTSNLLNSEQEPFHVKINYSY